MNIFKHSPDIKDKYRENPLNKKNEDIPEVEQGHRRSKDRYSNFNFDDPPEGYKAGDDDNVRHRSLDSYELSKTKKEAPLRINITPILEFLKYKRQLTNYTGRGNRVRILSKTAGHYIYATKPRHNPVSIAFDASIKNHFLYNPKSHYDNYNNFSTETDLIESKKNLNDPIPFQKSHPNLHNKDNLSIKLDLDDIYEKVHELRAPLSIFFIVDASASMCRSLDQIIKVIQSVHKEGYKKKDKVSIISFQGRESKILQRPAVGLSVALQKLHTLEPSSYTPMPSALNKTITMIHQEQIKGINIPVIIIMSDLGANISEKFPNLSAQTEKDFRVIEQEMDELARKIGKQQIKIIVMKPQKSFATRYLGINPMSVQRIQESLLSHANARIFEFDAYEPNTTIIQLKRILE